MERMGSFVNRKADVTEVRWSWPLFPPRRSHSHDDAPRAAKWRCAAACCHCNSSAHGHTPSVSCSTHARARGGIAARNRSSWGNHRAQSAREARHELRDVSCWLPSSIEECSLPNYIPIYRFARVALLRCFSFLFRKLQLSGRPRGNPVTFRCKSSSSPVEPYD